MSAPETPGVPARRAALRLLGAVLQRGLPLDAALPSATAGLANPADAALARAIATEALRRLPDLDALIDGATRNRLADDAKARSVLRLALTQALVLGTPPHAAIATALPLVDGGPRKLVHGVFGTLMRGGATLPAVPTLPPDVAARWERAWGAETVAAAARAIAEPPPLDLSLAREAALAPDGVTLAPRHRRLPSAPVAALPGYAEGGWWVQDLASSLPARLLGPGEGRHILDLCAAPGGKAMQLAAAGWHITAVDASESRLERLKDNLARTNLGATLVTADLLDWAPPASADAVLLDAPCTATGTFRRHPDVLHRVRPRAVAELAERQAAMLARAADWVKPGGTLVYAVCSLEPEEGEAQLDRFLAARPDYAPAPADPGRLPAGISPDARGFVRTRPGMLAEDGGLDGFFVAALRRL